MDGSEDSTGTYPMLSGAAGYAFRADGAPDHAGEPGPFTPDEEPPTKELDPLPYPRAELMITARTEPTITPQAAPAITARAAPMITAPEGLRRSQRMAAGLLTAAVLLGGGVLVGYGLIAGGAGPEEKAGTGPAFAAGTVDLAGSAGELTVSLGRTAGPVLVSAAAATVEGTVVRVTTDGSNPARLDVTLDERIAWTIRMNGGVRRATFVLTGGTVREVDLAGGADEVSLTLPEVDRALPIRMSGGVREWSILTTSEVPVRVRVQSGAGEVSLYGRREHGIARDTTLTAGDGSGLEVTAAAGFGSLAVRTPVG